MLLNASWIKVNTYRAALGAPGLATGGGVFCTSLGFVKGCFAVPLGNKLPFEEELLAAIFALETCWRYSWDYLCLEVDSTYLVQLLSFRSLDVPWFARAR